MVQELDRMPKVTGPSGGPDQVYISGRLNRLFTAAEDEAKRLKDDYDSIEHLLLPLPEDGGAAGSNAGFIIGSNGVAVVDTFTAVAPAKDLLAEIRKVTNLLSPNWIVHEPDGYWSGRFNMWAEAMEWATSFASRVEHWLEHQR